MPVAILAAVLVNILYSLVPAGRLRERAELVVMAVLGVTVVSRLYLAQEGLWDAVMGIVVGVAIPLAAFRLFAPNEDLSGHLPPPGGRSPGRHRCPRRGDRRGAGGPAGHRPGRGDAVQPRRVGGSTPLRITVKGEPETYLFAKLYATSHRSDRWYRLGRTLLYGRLEDEKSFNTVRRLVQYEDYMLPADAGRVARGAGAVRDCRDHSRAGVPAGYRVLRWGGGDRRRAGRR